MSSQKETNSLGNLEQHKDTRGNTSNIVLPVGVAETQTPKFPSLKRKTFQVLFLFLIRVTSMQNYIFTKNAQ